MQYEWASLKPHPEQPGSYLLLVRCHPSRLQRSLFKKTSRLKMFLGNLNDWCRYPSMNKPDPKKDPTIQQLNEMFLIAKQNPQ